MSFCLEDQKPQLPEPPSPPLGLFFLNTSGRDLGEQFCTDDFCQEVQARMSGHGECWCRKQISTGNTRKRRCFWPAMPEPAGTSRNFLSLPGPGRKLHYRVDPDRLATSVSRDQLKRLSLGQAQIQRSLITACRGHRPMPALRPFGLLGAVAFFVSATQLRS